MERKETFDAVSDLRMANITGTLRRDDDVALKVTIGIRERGTGYYEIYDVETGGETWYANGGLTFRGKKLVGYDGMYSLSHLVINKLEEWGYDTSEL